MRHSHCYALLLTAVSLFFGACKPPAASSEETSSAPDYTYGTVISFAQGGGSEPYRTFGWSKTEEKFTWTEGQSSGLAMKVPSTSSPVTLRMKLAALINPPTLPEQKVEVSVNGRQIATWSVATTSEFGATIPGDLTTRGGILTITLKVPGAASPKALGLAPDGRVLGLSCFQVELEKAG